MSVKRLREFLKAEELDPENTSKRDEPPIGEFLQTMSAEYTFWPVK